MPGYRVIHGLLLMGCSSATLKRCFSQMPDSPKEPKDSSGWGQMAGYAQLAMLLPAATVVGWLIGAALDHWLHTTWLYLAGLIVGIIAGFVELIRLVTSSESKP